jgi:hypothetical protein
VKTISLSNRDDGRLARHVSAEAVSSVDAALQLGHQLATEAIYPGEGATAELWGALASIAAIDLGAARAIEPHLDALAILHEADVAADPASSWGVFASEAPGTTLEAVEGDLGWTLTGTKQWCSLAGSLDSALISASGRLWSVDLHDAGISVDTAAWRSRGLVEIPSGPVTFDTVGVEPVGAAGWYLERPGFHWGSIGVAACWFGGAVGLARTLYAANPRGDIALMHLGAIDEQLETCRAVLTEAAIAVDLGEPCRVRAKRVRATVARTVDDVLLRVSHALGPAPLALDAAHAKRVADLQLYVRQHHAERDLASLGGALIEGGDLPW